MRMPRLERSQQRAIPAMPFSDDMGYGAPMVKKAKSGFGGGFKAMFGRSEKNE